MIILSKLDNKFNAVSIQTNNHFFFAEIEKLNLKFTNNGQTNVKTNKLGKCHYSTSEHIEEL